MTAVLRSLGLLALTVVAAAAGPASVAQAEHDTALTGTLTVVPDETGSGENRFVIRSGLHLHFLADPQPRELLGQSVTVRDADPDAPGVQGKVTAAQDEVATAQRGRSASTVRKAADAKVRARTTAVLRVVWASDPGDPATPAQIADAFDGPDGVNALYARQSGGALKFTGSAGNPSPDVFPRSGGTPAAPLVIAKPADCGDPADAIIRAIPDQVAAQVDSYDHVIVAHARVQCGSHQWEGLATLGDATNGRGLSWINDVFETDSAVSVIAHELGHNLGANHAGLAGGDGTGDTCTISDTARTLITLKDAECAYDTYGDATNLMGFAVPAPPLMGAWHRYEAGIVPGAQVGNIVNAGVYPLYDVNSVVPEPSGHQLLQLWHGERGPMINFELRRGIDRFDTWGAGSPQDTGVMVRIVNDPLSYGAGDGGLLDMSHSGVLDRDGIALGAPLQQGQTFRDAHTGVEVTHMGTVAGKVTLSVYGTGGTPPQPPAPPPPSDPYTPPYVPPYTPPAGGTGGATGTGGGAYETRPATKVSLERPRLRNGRAKLPSSRRIQVAAPGAAKIQIVAGKRRVTTLSGSATFRLTSKQRRKSTVKVVASGGTLKKTLRLTLRVRSGTITVAK